jgi:hypothetical protein
MIKLPMFARSFPNTTPTVTVRRGYVVYNRRDAPLPVYIMQLFKLRGAQAC